jgi:uncharacterized protein (TIGR02145 family)
MDIIRLKMVAMKLLLKIIIIVFLSIGLVLIMQSCKRTDLPTVTTSNVSAITQTSVVSGGNVTDNGGEEVTARGVCWSTTEKPTISPTNKTSNGTGNGAFTGSIIGLTPKTKYYVRAYATNSEGTGYGNEVSFTTNPLLVPTLTTTTITSVTATTAVSGGNIANDGGGTIIARGVCWNTSSGPTIANNKTINGTGTGSFTSDLIYLQSGTTYYVRAYATNSEGTGYGNEVSFSSNPVLLATLTTATPSSITETTAVSGGNIISDGGGEITERGVCWSTASPPLVTGLHKAEMVTTDAFTSKITGLTEITKYYIRAYANNSAGTAYGDEKSFTTEQIKTATDIDGNVYNTVTIGTQTWMVENLKTTKFNNGDLIGTTTPANLDINDEINPKYQWAYEGNESNVGIYGRLYTWYAITDTRGVCPTGWHLPSDAEWATLENFLVANGFNYDGTTTGNKYAKSLASVSGWTASSNAGAVGNTDYPGKRNSTGFTALPGGYHIYIGSFFYVGRYGSWWSATEDGATYAWYRNLLEISSEVYRLSDNKKYGFSVRCIKD